MSLRIGKFIKKALSEGDKNVLGTLAPVAYLGEKLPTTIYWHTGGQVEATEDDMEAGDSCSIDIQCCDETYASLVEHLVEVRELIRDAICGSGQVDTVTLYGFKIDDYDLAIGPAQFDDQKSCYFQSLIYTFHTQLIQIDNDNED